MLNKLSIAVLLTSLTTSLHAEEVETTDGRTILLNEDGTYEFIETVGEDQESYIELSEPFFERHSGDYGQERVRFMPIYRNVSETEILGIKFDATFKNAFGEDAFTFSGESNERVNIGRQSTHDLFYYFEDNQFMGGQPYDILNALLLTDTRNIEVVVTKIVFQGGDVVDFVD